MILSTFLSLRYLPSIIPKSRVSRQTAGASSKICETRTRALKPGRRKKRRRKRRKRREKKEEKGEGKGGGATHERPLCRNTEPIANLYPPTLCSVSFRSFLTRPSHRASGLARRRQHCRPRAAAQKTTRGRRCRRRGCCCCCCCCCCRHRRSLPLLGRKAAAAWGRGWSAWQQRGWPLPPRTSPERLQKHPRPPPPPLSSGAPRSRLSSGFLQLP